MVSRDVPAGQLLPAPCTCGYSFTMRRLFGSFLMRLPRKGQLPVIGTRGREGPVSAPRG